MKKIFLAGIMLVSILGCIAYPAPKGLNVPGDLTVTGTTGATGKIYAPAGVNAIGGSMEADYFIGDGTNVSNVTASTAAYSTLSGTASFAADLTLPSQTIGAVSYFDGSNWVILAPGTVNYGLRSGGPGAAPYYSPTPFTLTGNTIEATEPTNDLAFLSDTRIFMDSSKTRFVQWSSGNNRFEFNGDLYSGGILGGQFVGIGTSISSLDATNITQGIVGVARGGVGRDTAGAAHGSILYMEDDGKWQALNPSGTPGWVLASMGTGQDPVWQAASEGFSLYTINGIGGGPITTLVGTIEAKFDNDTIVLDGSGSLEVAYAPYAVLAGTASTAAAVDDGAITASMFASGSVTSGAIANGTVTAADMGTGSVTKGAISATDGGSNVYLKWDGSAMLWATPPGGSGSVEVDEITTTYNVNGSIEVKAGGLDASRYAAGSVTSGAIADGAISAVDMGTGSVTKGAISATDGGTDVYLKWNGTNMLWAIPPGGSGSIEVDEITTTYNVNGSIEVKAGGLDASRYAAGSVTSGAIANGTITAADMGTASVTEDAIGSSAVTGAKLAADINISTTGYITAETLNATYLYGDGTNLDNISADTAGYAALSGTASLAADLVLTSQATGDVVYFNGTNWVRLPAGTAGYHFESGGPGVAPSWSVPAWKVTGNTIEATTSSNNVAFNSDAFILLDNSRTKYLRWSSGNSRFEFNDKIFVNGTVSADGSSLFNLNAARISAGTLGPARGGLGSDVSGAGQGQILYKNSAGNWVALSPGTSNYILKTKGPGANPSWEAENAGSVTSIGAGRGLTTSSNPITTTGVLTIDTTIVVTTSDAQVLTNKTISGAAGITSTGTVTISASNFGLNVANDAFIQGKVAIGATGFLPPPSTEALRVDAGPSASENVISAYGNVNSDLGVNVQNQMAGALASTNITARADNVGPFSGFIAMGINSSVYNNPSYILGPNDTYLAGSGNKMVIGCIMPSQPIIFITGGMLEANKRMTVHGNGNVGIATMEPTATLEVYGRMKIGRGGVADPGANGLGVGGNARITGVVTAAAFVGTFEGTYTGVYEKGVAFLYPYTTSQSFIRLPYNAEITSVEVYCNGGTNVTGRVYNAGAAAYITAAGVSATAGNWAVAPSISTPNYTANQTLRFETSVVTGTVSGATVLVRYKRRP
ncbi:beta strand repeat-containing protein [Candidatus Margulisiibacteriota bacterium]